MATRAANMVTGVANMVTGVANTAWSDTRVASRREPLERESAEPPASRKRDLRLTTSAWWTENRSPGHKPPGNHRKCGLLPVQIVRQ